MTVIHPFYCLILPFTWLVACNALGIQLKIYPYLQNIIIQSLSWIKNGLHIYLCHYKWLWQNYLTQHLKSLILSLYCSLYYDSTSVSLCVLYLLSSWINHHTLFTRYLSDLAHEWLTTHCNSTSMHNILGMYH